MNLDGTHNEDDGDAPFLPQIKTDYIPNELPEETFELIPSDIPQVPTISKCVLWDELYTVLYKASKIPTFSGIGKLSALLTIGDYSHETAERGVYAAMLLLSMNPALSWWVITNGEVSAAALATSIVEFSIYNPSKILFVYLAYKRSRDIKALYSCFL